MSGSSQPPNHPDADASAPAQGKPLATSAIGLPPMPIVPDYELLKRIGHGAYGDVWLARSQATGALRAAKIVWRHTFEDGRPFQREFDGLQRFERISREHPSQLALFHIGRNEAQGYFYYVMELADAAKPLGEDRRLKIEDSKESERASPHPPSSILDLQDYAPHTLRADLGKGRLPAAKVLEIGLALSEALSHLHANGLVHRDVKPSNVIFVNGRPKLADIGLVTDASDQCSIVGTEGYLPPEGPGTPQADIFALGKVLYEAATGLDRREFPKLPEDLRAWPDAAQVFELNEIILKACTNDPRERYASVEIMRGDLQRLQLGKSVKDRHLSQRRARAALKMGRVAVTFGVAAAGGIFLWQTVTRKSVSSIVPYNYVAANAYQLGFKQLRLGTAEGFRQASAAFAAAVKADPKSPAAHAGLFEAYLLSEDSGIPFNAGQSNRLNELAANLAKLGPTNAETRAARAVALWLNEGKLSEADNEFRLALRADDGSSMALTCYGYFLTRINRTNDAEKMLERALILDPTSPLILRLLRKREADVTPTTNGNAVPFPIQPATQK